MLVNIGNKLYDLSKPIDISLPLSDTSIGPNCFFAPPVMFYPYQEGNFIGDTREGSPVNFYNLTINPHGNGTHTECVGHITKERIYINDVLKQSHFNALLISVYPLMKDGDRVITKDALEIALPKNYTEYEAIIIRTLPNDEDKKSRVYSGSNPPYFEPEALKFLRECNFIHFITDLPSVDKEEDGGLLLSHKAWWNYPAYLDTIRTISELAYIPNEYKDGSYLLEFQIPNLSLDAAPSRIYLYLSL